MMLTSVDGDEQMLPGAAPTERAAKLYAPSRGTSARALLPPVGTEEPSSGTGPATTTADAARLLSHGATAQSPLDESAPKPAKRGNSVATIGRQIQIVYQTLCVFAFLALALMVAEVEITTTRIIDTQGANGGSITTTK
jgi:hypothetical protein